MTVVADAGPLIALAKIGGLGTLFDLYPEIITPPAVCEETVHEGHYVRAPDAALLQAEYETGRIRVVAPHGSPPGGIDLLGSGERESIHLAVQQRADWLLVDDLEARQSASSVFVASEAPTQVKGTLGIIISAYIEGLASQEHSLGLLDAVRSRGDIWISAELCRHVEVVLRRAAKQSPE